MIEMPFFTGLWLSFLIIFLSSFGVFFARSFKSVVMAGCLVLSGICLSIFNTDIFRAVSFGYFIITALWFLYLFQSLFFKWSLNTNSKKEPLFYALPFLSFITIAISLDLITLSLGLTIFGMSFIGLASLRGKDKKQILSSIQKLYLSFLSFSYGLACLYAREGTILLKDLYLKLQKGNWDSLTILGVYLLAFSVLIEIYAIIPLTGKKK